MQQRLALLYKMVQLGTVGLDSRESHVKAQGLFGGGHAGRDPRQGPSGRGKTFAIA